MTGIVDKAAGKVSLRGCRESIDMLVMNGGEVQGNISCRAKDSLTL